MNLFRFLTSTRGAIKPLNALLISGAAGAVFAYTVGTVSDRQVANERRVRTLSSIEAGSPQQGMFLSGGRLTSINVGDAGGRLATAEERAAFQNNRALDKYAANQRALEGMDGALGRAAQFGESDGLNTGNREVVQPVGQVVQGTSVDTTEEVAGAIYRAESDSSAGTRAAQPPVNRPSLAPASITRASGGSTGSSAGPITRGGSYGGQAGRVPSEGARLSGAMPSGSNIMSQRGLDKGPLGGAGTSNFRNGGREGYLARGPKGGRGKNELEDIAKRSARAAASNNPSANEGAQAFLTGATRLGGVVVENGAEDGNTSSEDLKNPSARKLRAIGNHLNKVEDEQEQRNKAHRALKWQMIATILATIGAMVAGALILSKLDDKIEASRAVLRSKLANVQLKEAAKIMLDICTSLRLKWALAFMTIVTAANAFMVYKANQFIGQYGASGGVGLAKACQWIAPILVGGMIFTVTAPKTMKKLFSSIWKQMKSALSPVGLLTGTAKDALLGSLFK